MARLFAAVPACRDATACSTASPARRRPQAREVCLDALERAAPPSGSSAGRCRTPGAGLAGVTISDTIHSCQFGAQLPVRSGCWPWGTQSRRVADGLLLTHLSCLRPRPSTPGDYLRARIAEVSDESVVQAVGAQPHTPLNFTASALHALTGRPSAYYSRAASVIRTQGYPVCVPMAAALLLPRLTSLTRRVRTPAKR